MTVRNLKKLALVTANLVVAGGLLWLLLERTGVTVIRTALTGVPPVAVAVACGALVVQTLVLGVRWRLVMAAIGDAPSYRETFAFMFVGLFFNQLLPTSFGGDAARVWQAYRAGVPSGAAINGVLLDRVSGVVGLALVVTLGVIAMGDRIVLPALRVVLIAPLPLAFAGVGVLVAIDRLPGRWRGLPVLRDVARLSADARVIFGTPLLATRLLVLAVLGHAISGIAAFALARGLGLDLAVWECIVLFSAVVLVTLVPVSFAGWGLREAAAVVIFGTVGFAAGEAFALSVLFGIALLVASLPGLVLWIGRSAAYRREVRDAETSSARRAR